MYKSFIPLCVILMLCSLNGWAQQLAGRRTLPGAVYDEKHLPLPGASVRLLPSGQGTVTDGQGRFTLSPAPDDRRLTVSFLGYEPKEIALSPDSSHYQIQLQAAAGALKEVVVSSGYQQMNKQRTTGSYATVGRELLERSVSTDVLSLLNGVTPGLVFDTRAPGEQSLSIRGRSTILSDNSPLIVVDNFPYDGDINNINPNDIETITVLRDAAAAAIWGARAGNGVIVITTKRGKLGQPARVEFNSSVTVGEKPDLFYNPAFLKAADFISVEKQLFQQGFYAAAESAPDKPILSPVVELLEAERDGRLSAVEVNTRINLLQQQDVRNDVSRYFYQKSVRQQYNLNINGGGDRYTYFVSGGYDRNRSGLVSNGDERYTFNAQQTIRLFPKLTLGAGINYIASKATTNNPGYAGLNSGGGKTVLYPYAQLADANGNLLAVARDYPLSYAASAQAQGLLDWQYRPLQELQMADNTTRLKDTRLTINLRYDLLPGLYAEGLYQYEQSQQQGQFIYSQDTYFTRNLINTYAQPDGSYPVPRAGILNSAENQLSSRSERFQLNYNKQFRSAHQLTALAGAELRDIRTQSTTGQLYGYDPGLLLTQPVDYTTYFTANPSGNSYKVPYVNTLKSLTDRFLSVYLNANYNYQLKYYLSASARKDASNLFGVNTNQKTVPLYSVGAGWEISRERFYGAAWMPYLKLRVTYGVSGNVNRSITAFTTAIYSTDGLTGQPNALIFTPPNPDLRWEQVKMFNLGLDFAAKDNRVSGSLEYFQKRGTDQLGSAALDPTTGFFISNRYSYYRNSAAIKGQGADLELNTRNLTGRFRWQTRFLFSYATDKVTSYENQNAVSDYLSPNSAPLTGRPVLGIYSYRWAGLDPATGDPQVYLKGAVTRDYSALAGTATVSDLVYNGPALPPYFGSILNTFNYHSWTFSFNVTYKFGYYFHRSSISYSDLINNWQGHEDFDQRWQKPGDEQFTQVPSLSLAGDANRDAAYINSSALVEKGDHIRLQDAQLAYTFAPKAGSRLPFQNLTVYSYATNLGILWRANHQGLDPDYVYGYSATRPVRTIAIGLRVHF